MVLDGDSKNYSPSSLGSHIYLMAKTSMVSPTLEAYLSRDYENEE
jgi:hypothetical protein